MFEGIGQGKKMKMAFIDVNYLVNQSKEVRELNADTAQKNKDLQIWLSKVNTEVMEQASQEEQQKLVNQYNNEFAAKQAAIKQEYAVRLQKIDAHITAIIAEEAKKLDYDCIFAKGTLLYGGEDITLQIAELVK